MLTGSCPCGDIAFEIDGPVDTAGHCRCSMCRKFHGSARATLGTTAPEDFRWVRGAERIRTYQSSAQGYRSFCPRCGSPLPLRGEDRPFALVPMGNVAEDPGTRPRLHFFSGSMAPWHPIVDDLPQHESYPAKFGPEAIAVDRPARKPKRPGAIGGSCLCGAVAFEFDDPPARMYNLPLLAMPARPKRGISDRSTRAPQRISLAGRRRQHHRVPIARNPVPMRVLRELGELESHRQLFLRVAQCSPPCAVTRRLVLRFPIPAVMLGWLGSALAT